MKVHKASEAVSKDPCLKGLIYGATGTAKTSWCAKSPNPLFILTEAQGIASINAANPDASVCTVGSFADFADIMRSVLSSKRMEDGKGFLMEDLGVSYSTLVIDSLTDLQSMLMKDMLGVTEEEMLNIKVNKVLTLQEWGKMTNIIDRLLRRLRSLSCNVLVICLEDERFDGESANRSFTPLLAGKKLAPTIGQYFNFVGRTTLVQGRHCVWFKPGQNHSSKPAPGWPDVIPNSLEAGNVTLGSLLLYTFKGEGTMVPHNKGDSASFVETVIEKQRGREKKEEPKSRARGRR